VSYYAGDKEIAQVTIADATGGVIEAWTGFKVPWAMARGYPGAFGRKINALYLWLPLSLLFVVPFVDPRRPFRWLHLDLLVLSAFSVSLAFFNHADVYASVPIVYPLLGYLLLRMLAIGWRRRRGPEPEPLRLLVPASWLAVAIVFLLGFRIGLNLTDSNVIDVGYAGVIGADRIADGTPLYGGFPKDNEHGDTYGPVTYEAYVPFEQAMPWGGRWDGLPAAHAAAIFFDLLCIALLWLLGRRIRGPTLGISLAYAWATYPFTLFLANTNANDGLVAALILAVVLVASSPPARGALAALAGFTKFAPLALAPLFATHGLPDGRRRRIRALGLFAATFAAASLLAFLPLLGHFELREAYDRTVGFQASRGSPFSLWGLYDLKTLQTVVQVAAVALALAAAFVPRRRDVIGLAALAAAVLIALQMGVTHWFYLYIPWFFPLVMVALLGRGGESPRASAPIPP
jgi:Glycosyltransferase family 87